MEKRYASINRKKEGMFISISGIVEFRGKKVIIDREEHYILIKMADARGRRNNLHCVNTNQQTSKIH